ncbi:hypothetical protein [Chroogloeocystis siderophila]|jgi:hypothetical protein|uniref:Uncharacterized protein n=1 Tax=Chroogloeocystis siderophila 5.2 s.c.1 TaxID=247279 RepID=A0A1U7HS68_9CHRO|nr:hypothetical protein [Chroogloeocystis siderophila]OKH26417.1 hypothetical protein NIES1031_11765 [Chroogloeocystis siderophila 5.2 s.c.1]
MKRLLAIFALLSTGLSVVVAGSLFLERALTQSQPDQPNNSFSPERLEKIKRFSSLFQARSLTNASPQEVQQAAINYTLANSSEFTVRSGAIKTVFTRPITFAEFPSIGLGEVNFIGEEPPMMLVVVKGDFDTTDFVPSFSNESQPTLKERIKAKYIAYVFDLRAGRPTLTTTALTGGYFRKVLNDSSLPDEPKLIKPEPGMPEAVPALSNPPAKKLPYGSIISDK